MVAFIKKVYSKKNTPIEIVEKTKEEKLKDNALNQLPLKEHLAQYGGVFSKDLDEMWKEVDTNSDGYLNPEEARAFLEETTKVVDKEKGQYYFPANFDALFKKFDVDGDKILTKSEMA